MDNSEVNNKADEISKDDEMRTPSPKICLEAMVKKVEEKEYTVRYDQEYLQLEEYEKLREGPTKRDREEEEDGWQLVNKQKKIKFEDKIELYISSRQQLPKQFALAKLFKDLGLVDIIKIKYLSAYKIRVEFENIVCMERMITCKELIDKGWTFHQAFQVSYSYGIIRHVDLELKEEEIIDKVRCDSRAVLSTAVRLQRREASGSWVPSETVRLGFKGSYLPPHIYVDNLRIKVEPFVFPVSQCSKCWKLGHTQARCPTDKIVCPKCGGQHGNCETKTFVCVNCQGSHMALSKTCPAFLKEKRIREIMSEFNCTYRKARTMYVPKLNQELDGNHIRHYSFTDSTPSAERRTEGELTNRFSPLLGDTDNNVTNDSPTYAAKVKTQVEVHADTKPKARFSNKLLDTSGKKPPSYNVAHQAAEAQLQSDALHEDKKEQVPLRDVTFSELLSRLKEIIFLKGGSVQQKLTSALRCCFEWLVLVVVENITDWPIVNLILNYCNG